MLTHKTRTRNGASNLLLLVMAPAVVISLWLGLTHKSFTPSGQGSPSQSSHQSYTNAEYGYSITYPQGWRVADQSNKAAVTLASAADANSTQGGTNFSRRKVVDQTAQATPSNGLSKVDILAFELETQLTAQEFMLTRTSVAPEGVLTQLNLNGYEAIRVEAQTARTLQHNSDNLNYISVFVTSGKTGYIIAGFAAPEVFEDIVNSFRLS